jgi:hypothetical protein
MGAERKSAVRSQTDAIDPKRTFLVYLLRTNLVATGTMTMTSAFLAARIALWAGAACLILCIGCTSASACMPSSLRDIVFEDVPTDIDAPVIIRATIYARSVVGDAVGRQIILMNARVEQVIKGPIEAKELKIFVPYGSCIVAGVGQGIILGKLQDDSRHGLMLSALGRSDYRLWSEDFKQKQHDISEATRRYE